MVNTIIYLFMKLKDILSDKLYKKQTNLRLFIVRNHVKLNSLFMFDCQITHGQTTQSNIVSHQK